MSRVLGEHARTIAALLECAQACTVCADACLAEEKVDMLRRCIRTDLDCSDVCFTTVRIASRQTETPSELLHQQLHTCILACQVCADECELHRDVHEHCRLCAETCRHCQEMCNRLLGDFSDAGTVPAEDIEGSRR
jgi:hypothetical protein